MLNTKSLLVCLLLQFGWMAESSARDGAKNDSSSDNEDTKTSEDSESKETSKPKIKPGVKKKPKVLAPDQKGLNRPPPEVKAETAPPKSSESEEESKDGVVKPKKKSLFQKMTETDEDFGLIFRPQLGVTSLTVGDETKMGGHLGLNLGYKKFSGLKLTKIGFYSRTRGLFLPTVGETFALDTRLGCFVGIKVSAFVIETGVDVLYHSISASGLTLPDDNFGSASLGIGVPVQALFITDQLKLKAGVQPIWYLASDRQYVDWSSQSTGIPLDDLGEGLGHELAWTVGASVGLIGLSYTQHEMAGGTQRVISLGLQR